MNVVIVGGHGKIGMRLAKLLAERGDSPRGIIRKTEQAPDLEEIGAEPIVLDIENVETSTTRWRARTPSSSRPARARAAARPASGRSTTAAR